MSLPANEDEMKVSQTEVTVTKTEVSGTKEELEKAILADIGKVGKSALQNLSGFRAFILRGNVVDLAIGIVIGAAFTAIVTALVKDIITPLIPSADNKSLANATIIIPWSQGRFAYGDFINAIISFLIVAAVLYFFVVKPVNRLMKLYQPKEAMGSSATRECPYCFQMVSGKATRCPYCTSVLPREGENTEGNGPVLMLPDTLEVLSDKLAERIIRRATTTLEKTGVATTTSTSESETAEEK